MKNKNLLLPLFLLLLAGCGPTTSTSNSTGTEVPGTSTVPGTEVPGTTEDSEPPVPTLPPVTTEDVPPTEVISIEDARKLAPEKGAATIQGRITAIYGFSGGNRGMTVQNGNYAISLTFMTVELASQFAVGDIIQVSGNVEAYNGLIQLVTPKGTTYDIKKVDVEVPALEPLVLTSWDEADLKAKGVDGRWIKANNLEKVSGTIDPTGSAATVKFRFKGTTVEIPMYASNHFAAEDRVALADKLNNLKSNDTINFEGPIGAFNSLQLNPVDPALITVVEGEAPVGPVAPTAITLNPTFKTLEIGETIKPEVTISPADATKDGLTFTSADTAVATVAEDGTITAVAAGQTKVTAAIGEVKGEIEIKVNGERPVDPTATVVEFNKGELADDNTALLTPENFKTYLPNLPEGTTIGAENTSMGTGGGDQTNGLSTGSVALKFGTSSKAGALTITLPAATQITKVTIEGRAWSGTASAITINGVSVDPMLRVSKEEADTVGTYTFEFAATNVIEISTAKRNIITYLAYHVAA